MTLCIATIFLCNMSMTVTRGTHGGQSPPRILLPGKMCWTVLKNWALSENSSPYLVSQAGYGPVHETIFSSRRLVYYLEREQIVICRFKKSVLTEFVSVDEFTAFKLHFCLL